MSLSNATTNASLSLQPAAETDAIIIGARGQVDIDELREAEHESK